MISVVDDSCLAGGSVVATGDVLSAGGFVVPHALSAVPAAMMKAIMRVLSIAILSCLREEKDEPGHVLMSQIRNIRLAYLANRKPSNPSNIRAFMASKLQGR